MDTATDNTIVLSQSLTSSTGGEIHIQVSQEIEMTELPDLQDYIAGNVDYEDNIPATPSLPPVKNLEWDQLKDDYPYDLENGLNNDFDSPNLKPD